MSNYFPNGFTNYEAITWGPETQAKAYAQQADGRHMWVHNAFSTAAQESIIWGTDGSINIRTLGSWRNVMNFGAAGDGTTDVTTAIQAAIDSLPTSGGIVFFPLATYRHNSPITIIDNTASNNRKGITLLGCNGGASGGSLNTVLEYGGSTTTPGLRILSRDCVVKDLVVRARATVTCDALVDIDAATGAGAGTCTNNRFDNIRVTGGGGATITNGVRIAATAAANGEYMRFDRCYLDSFTNACVNIADTVGQSKFNRFHQCSFNTAAYGIDQNLGSFTADACTYGSLTAAAIRLVSQTDAIIIRDSDEESCARFLISSGGSSVQWPVTISGGRFAANSLHADGEYIQFTNGGPLTIQGGIFGAAAYLSTFKVTAHCAVPGAILISIGNAFPTETPYKTDATDRFRLISLGNRGLTSASAVTNIDDQIARYVADATGGANLATITGLSGTLTAAANLRGSVTLQGATSSGQEPVTFSTAAQEANNSYFIALSGNENRSYWVTSKSTSGFNINASATTSTATIDWHLIR